MKTGWNVCSAFVLLAIFSAPKITAAEPSRTDWELVRSVPNLSGGVMMHYVLIPERKQRDTRYYKGVAARACGSSKAAMVFFWTDRKHIPESAWMPVRDMRVMTATYERSPSYKKPALRLAAWLYPTPEAARQAHCFYPS